MDYLFSELGHALPRHATPRLTSPHLTSVNYLTLPYLTSPHLTLPRLISSFDLTMSISSTQHLIDACESTRKTFSDKFYPLTTERLQAIQKCTAIVRLDRGLIGKNRPKRRAHIILTQFWTYCPEVFILCALSIYPTALVGLKTVDYLEIMLRWWEQVEHPKGLTAVLIQYPDILPGKPNIPCKFHWRFHFDLI
jgi:hypothetical protein